MPRSCKCFEVDAPTTQKEKRGVLARAGICAEHVCFVPVDFNADSWLDKLIKVGFNPARSTVFTWEGVGYYLEEAVVQHATLALIARCADALVAYDVFYGWYSLHPTTTQMMSMGWGEPFASGVSDGDEGADARRAGLVVCDVLGPQTASTRRTKATRRPRASTHSCLHSHSHSRPHSCAHSRPHSLPNSCPQLPLPCTLLPPLSPPLPRTLPSLLRPYSRAHSCPHSPVHPTTAPVLRRAC